MANALTVLAITLAWLAFRLERHSARLRDAAEAVGTMRAAWHGIVEMREPLFGVVTGWGQIFFAQDFVGIGLLRRAAQTRRLIRQGVPDQIFLVPTEPLKRLAAAKPSSGLITEQTVSAANFALWRVTVFNQLVAKQTAWNVAHATDIADPRTSADRRRALANAAAAISLEIHRFGVGRAWSTLPGGGRGWYGAFVETLSRNLADLERPQESRWHSYVGDGWFPLIDLGLTAALIASFVLALD